MIIVVMDWNVIQKDIVLIVKVIKKTAIIMMIVVLGTAKVEYV